MFVIDKVRDTFKAIPYGSVFTTQEIKEMVCTKFDKTNPKSVIPSDYSYNMTNKGKIGSLENFNIFIQIRHGVYQYVGEHYGNQNNEKNCE